MAIRILLVEDSELDARSIARAVSGLAGLSDVVRVADLSGAIAALNETTFDCILLDLSLPDSEGLAGVELVVSMAGECPTVVLTGLDDPSIAVRAVESGAQDYLVKDGATSEVIERSVRYAIARSETEASLVAAQRQLEAVQTREQIARDLHDTVIQRLYATGLSLQAGIGLASDRDLRARIENAVDDLDSAIKDLRQAIFGLHSHETETLVSEITNVAQSFADALGFAPSVEVDAGLVDLDDGLRHDLVSAVREGLSNLVRHTEPSAAYVTMSAEDQGLIRLSVRHVGPCADSRASQDNRAGGHQPGAGQGLNNLRERAQARGGELTLEVSEVASELALTMRSS